MLKLKLPAIHVERRVRIRRSDFDRLLEERYGGRGEAHAAETPTIWDGEVAPPEIP
jgi:hypothetical protein